MRVAAVVPTYNRATMLRECLMSLLEQTHPLAQIIVVDDGSTDDTGACIREFGDKVLALSQPNSGKSKAINRALPLVKAEYVWLFDDDDIALPDSVERRVDEALQTSEDYDMLLRLARRFPAMLLNEPTFVFRQHEGARGRADARYGADEREARFARNNALIGRRLREELALGDYLAPRQSELTGADRKMALINRMSVMASKGLISEMLEDARAFSQADDAATELTAEERRKLVRAVQHRYLLLAINATGSRFVRESQVLAATVCGESVLRSMARGMIGLARWSAGSNGERLAVLSAASRLAALSLSKPHLETTP